ncbi:glycoside hydrolase family 16 protein [Chryseobacterium sp. A321]
MKSLIAVLVLATLTSCQTKVPLEKDGLKLVWSDEFNYQGLPDSSKWEFEEGGSGFGNHELQYYTKNRLKNARVEKGKLVIEAHKESWDKNEYTSAKLQTKSTQTWTYGRIEVRAKLPKGRGTWPAIWMMSEKMKSWPKDGEIDIMEHVGYNPGFIHSSVHTQKYNHVINTQKTDTLYVKNAMDKFHVYTLDWTPEKVDVYVDDVKFYTYENQEKTYEAWPLDQPFYLILNQAVGGDWGGKEGVDPSIYPQKFYIDYVRVYQ